MRSAIARLCGTALAFLVLAGSAAGATFTVTTTNSSGAGSLTQAILDANAAPGPDRIEFALLGPGPFVIAPPSSLPALTDAVIVDGRTQPGWVAPGPPRVQLDGSNVGSGAGVGITFGEGADGSELYGLSITGWGSRLTGGGGVDIGAADVLVGSCWIGLTPDGGSSGNLRGLVVRGPRARIGGDGSRGNVIAASVSGGVVFFLDGASGATVLGNYIGTDASGIEVRPNGFIGIELDRCSNVRIGGETEIERNVIGGADAAGIRIQGVGGSRAEDNEIHGNYIGVGADGATAIPNGVGIEVLGATRTAIGDLETGNVIAGNSSHGVLISGIGNELTILRDNTIGFDATMALLPNGGDAVRVESASDNRIGQLGAGNRIAYSGTGVSVVDASGTAILGNSFESAGAGPAQAIDLGADGLTPNDVGDLDIGANSLQNAPELLEVSLTDLPLPTIEVRYQVDSDPSAASFPIFVDVFAADRTGRSIGEFLGCLDLSEAEAASGGARETLALPSGIDLADLEAVVATATTLGNDTSEFSAPFALPEPPSSVAGTAVVGSLTLLRRRRSRER